jgi:hypothetical protein
MVGEHTCETENPRVFLAKHAVHRWFDQYPFGFDLGLDRSGPEIARRTAAAAARTAASSGGGA